MKSGIRAEGFNGVELYFFCVCVWPFVLHVKPLPTPPNMVRGAFSGSDSVTVCVDSCLIYWFVRDSSSIIGTLRRERGRGVRDYTSLNRPYSILFMVINAPYPPSPYLPKGPYDSIYHASKP